MNRFKGTAAPWSQLPEESDKPYIRIRGTNIGCRYKIANVLTPCYDGVKSREADETRANARLIASCIISNCLTLSWSVLTHCIAMLPALSTSVDVPFTA